MPNEIDIRVTPSLHSETLKSLDGYSEATHPFVAPLMTLFDDAYGTIGKIHDARDAAKKNSAWNENQKILNVASAAFKQQQRLLAKFDAMDVTLQKQIDHFEKELSMPLEAKAGAMVSAEIRAHFKGLTSEARRTAMHAAIKEKDFTTVSAVLGAPSYLAGFDPKMASLYIRSWHAAANPEVEGRLKVVKSAKEMLMERGVLVVGEVEKAIGAKWSEVNKLEGANNRALEALQFERA